jgi:hypothetical protein
MIEPARRMISVRMKSSTIIFAPHHPDLHIPDIRLQKFTHPLQLSD